ncbi:hypothetical protein ACR0ST_13285 [Aliidiomarina sp. Khilg15.8]
MWLLRILQLAGVLLAITTVVAAVLVSNSFPLQEPDNPGNRVAGAAYLVLVVPPALLYLVLGATSTLFLVSKDRRAAYGFTNAPWRYLFRANFVVLVVLLLIQVVPAILFALYAAFSA